MNSTMDTLKTSVCEYCATIGADPLLVQGAGGNVSWKEGDTLWVKASGTWLAKATEKDIFVAVDLSHLRIAIENKDFSVMPRPFGESVLRPSIETLLHALMPHQVVVHLHAIEILAHLVHDDCQKTLAFFLDTSIRWAIVDYYKPGQALAAAVNTALNQKPNVEVIFLKNHGVVIGAANIVEVNRILQMLIKALTTSPTSLCVSPISPSMLDHPGQYSRIQDADLQQLALNTELFNRLNIDWALYPDHVVFLGARAFTYDTRQAFLQETKEKNMQPELIFIRGEGVFAMPTFNEAKYAQLRCYYEVIVRQRLHSSIRALTQMQIAELLNWDAEQYRMNLSH